MTWRAALVAVALSAAAAGAAPPPTLDSDDASQIDGRVPDSGGTSGGHSGASSVI